MNYIRIKVRTALIISAAFIITLLFASNIYGIFNYTAGKISMLINKDDAALVYFKRVNDSKQDSIITLYSSKGIVNSILDRSSAAYQGDKFMLEYGSTGKSGGYSISYEDITKLNKDYYNLKSRYSGKYFNKYELEVAIVNWFTGDSELAVSILEKQINENNEELEAARVLNLAAMYMGMGEVEKARTLLDKNYNGYETYDHIKSDLYAYIHFMLGDRDRFHDFLNDKQERFLLSRDINKLYMEPLKNMDRLMESIDEYYTKTKPGTNTVSGQVNINGRPLPYTVIYLVNASRLRGWSSLQFNDAVKLAFSDSEGHYSIVNMPDGDYYLRIMADWQRVNQTTLTTDISGIISLHGNEHEKRDIDFHKAIYDVSITHVEPGRVLIDWEYDYADEDTYYTISIGELFENSDSHKYYQNHYFSDKIHETQYLLDINEERKNSISGALSYGLNGIEPGNIVEPLYHTGEYVVRITGYSKPSGISTNSYGLGMFKPRDTFKLDGFEWTEADKLLLDRKYEEAIRKYEKAVGENPEDLHSLKPLAGLCFNGYKYNVESHELEGKDMEKALKYYSMLLNIIPGNYQANHALARIYESKGEYGEALNIYHKMLIDSKSNALHLSIGKLYLKIGNLVKALESHKLYFEEWGYGCGDVIAECILLDDMVIAREYADKFKGRLYYADYKKAVEYLNSLDRSGFDKFFEYVYNEDIESALDFLDGKEDNLSLFYAGILKLITNTDSKTREENYLVYYDKVKNPQIKDIMKYIGRELINTGFGDEY